MSDFCARPTPNGACARRPRPSGKVAASAVRRFRPTHLRHILGMSKPTRGPRVLAAARFTALAAPGGGEVQLRSTVEALSRRGVAVRLWRPWETPVAEAQVLHLFGSSPEMLPLAESARRAGVKVVLSTIAWFDLASLWREPWSVGRRVAAIARLAVRRAVPQLPTWRRKLYDACDLLLPNSRAEAQQLERLFAIEPKRIHVVPNGADARFAHPDPTPFEALVGRRGYVLYAGRIEPRKNQLGFLRAMRGAGTPIVVLGDVVPGHEAYMDACRQAADEHVTFVPRRPHGDPLLASAYAASGCLALASWYETPGLVALEAGMSGVPLVLPQGGCAREYFGEMARYVHPNRPAEIRAAVKAALAEGRNARLAHLVRNRYTWAAAAAETHRAYERLLS